MAHLKWLAPALLAATSMAMAAPPITTGDALTNYLALHEGKPTPLDALPAGARARFLAGIRFDRGQAYPQLADITLLPKEQGKQILALFGLSSLAENPALRWAEAPLQAPTGISDFEARYNDHLRAAQGASLDKAFPELAMPGAIRRLSSYELVLLLRLLRQAQFDQLQASHADAVLAASKELLDRGALPGNLRELPYDTLLLARRFDDARRYAASLPTHPAARFDDRPAAGKVAAAWQQLPATGVWRPEAIDLAPTQILVLAGCHFSDDAATAIERDPVLGPAFAQHARWLAEPPGIEDMDAVEKWNQRHPAQPILPIHDRQQWALLPEGWEMPTFLVIRDGKVIDRRSGWPAGDPAHRRSLLAMLRRAGLLPAPAQDAG